jgi:hypothetical protein
MAEPVQHTLHDLQGNEFLLWTTPGGFMEVLDDLCAVAKQVPAFRDVPEQYINERYAFMRAAYHQAGRGE